MRKHSTSLKKKKPNGTTLRAKKTSKKEMARLQTLKEYFDSLDEETHDRELEKLSLDDLHSLAWMATYESYQKGTWLT